MSKMTKRELEKRKAELKRMVHAEMVRREVLQFRLEPDNIDKLYQIAMKKRKPVGTLIREWVTNNINSELAVGQTFMVRETAADYGVNTPLAKLKSDLQSQFNEIMYRITTLEAAANKREGSKKK